MLESSCRLRRINVRPDARPFPAIPLHLKSARIQAEHFTITILELSAALLTTREDTLFYFRILRISRFRRQPESTMTGRGGGGGGGGRGKVLLPPINFIFKLLQQRSTVSIWLFEQLAIRIEGKIRVCNLQRSHGEEQAKTRWHRASMSS